ncbi:MAG: DUF349 domain-containing protein [Salinivirgaceae bacterium]|nr:DUF349 domain-containing protein [Salinivirgaceae bacterium]
MNLNPNQTPGNENAQAPDFQNEDVKATTKLNEVTEDTTETANQENENAENSTATVVEENTLKEEPAKEESSSTEQSIVEPTIDVKDDIVADASVVATPDTAAVVEDADVDAIDQDDEDDEAEESETEDYNTLSKEELIEKLKLLVDTNPITKVSRNIDLIRTRYNELVEEETDKEKADFIAEGNEEVNFEASEDPFKAQFYTYINTFRTKYKEYKENQERSKEDNLKLKYAVIEKIENLINTEESLNKTFNEFYQLQEEWRNIGLVPQGATKHLYETYHHHIERFYDFIKINKELRELDFKKNMEQKLDICEKAELLILETSVIKAFKTLQEFHKQWREIGPVARDKKEELWERFKDATAKVNQRHHEHYVGLKEEQEKNLEQKRILCVKVEEINKLTLVKPKKWEEKAQEIIEIQKLWKAIGFAPRKENNEIFEQFKNECDKFFTAKRAFFDERRKEEQNNMQLKNDLCEQAEALKESTDWKQTTADFIKLQKAWKEIGAVPRKHSETIWQRFRTACDAFFNAKSQHFGNVDKQQAENLVKKQEIIDNVVAFEITGDSEADMKTLSDFQSLWSETGFVPFSKKDQIQKEFRAAINVHFDKLGVSPQSPDMFKNKLRNWNDNPRGKTKVNSERSKLVVKIRDLENEIALYENNIGFFNNSANAANMIKDILHKIEKAKQHIIELKEKLSLIDTIDNEA